MTNQEIIEKFESDKAKASLGIAGGVFVQTDLVHEIVKALEQEPHYNPDEWCHNCSEYDHEKHCCPRYNKVIRNAVEEMKQEPCEDCISRQAAQEGLNHLMDSDGFRDSVGYVQKSLVRKMLVDLSPVQPKPKTGHWINKKPRWIPSLSMTIYDAYECSNCGEPGVHWWKHCINCGARMIDVPDINDGKLSEISTGSKPQESEET